MDIRFDWKIVTLLALAACSGGGDAREPTTTGPTRVFQGSVTEPQVKQVRAITPKGKAFVAPVKDGAFSLEVPSTEAFVLTFYNGSGKPVSVLATGDKHLIPAAKAIAPGGAGLRAKQAPGTLVLGEIRIDITIHIAVSEVSVYTLIDTDGDGFFDFEDDDLDNDGIPNVDDTDEDGDGTLDADEDLDNDGDGLLDVLDDDDDNDGVLDASDADANGDGTEDTAQDFDHDGIPDWDDDDIDGDGLPNDQDDNSGVEVCDDSIDNDGDGAADDDDSDCAEQHDEDCGDGIDNDGDGEVDGDDPDCRGGARTEICDDGIDNDGDGQVDRRDPDCAP